MTKRELISLIEECIEKRELKENNIEDIDSVNEATIFISKEGKELKQKIKDFLKSKREKVSLRDQIGNGDQKCDKIKQKILPGIEKCFNTIFSSNMVRYDYSGGGSEWSTILCGIKGKYIYSFAIQYTISNNSAFMTYFNEIDTDSPKCVVPIEAAKIAINNSSKSNKIYITNNTIKVQNLTSDKHDKELYNNIASKYPNAKIGLTGLKFTK